MKILIIALFGLIFGSFASMASYRFIVSMKMGITRSECPYCHHVLKVMDLIPVVSWLFLKGKCRYCHRKISVIYPVLEILCMIGFIMIYLGWSDGFLLCVYLLSFVCMLIMSMVDMQILKVPVIVLVLMEMLSISVTIMEYSLWLDHIVGSLIISIPMLVLYFIKKDAIGSADVVILHSLGLLLGFSNILYLSMLSYLSAGIYAFILLLMKGKDKNYEVAMFPFFTLALLCVLHVKLPLIFLL